MTRLGRYVQDFVEPMASSDELELELDFDDRRCTENAETGETIRRPNAFPEAGGIQ